MTDLLAFGEVMLRLSPPGRTRFLQTPSFDVWVGGAEANVVTQLALLGHQAGLVSALPQDPLGAAAVFQLRGHGVDVSRVRRSPGRMGLYFVESGAGHRATEVVYDRAGSAFANVAPDGWDWASLLAGVRRLHLTGITPALCAGTAESAIAAGRAASKLGVPVSFEGNWRGKLWQRWNGDAPSLLCEIVRHADVLFGDGRDVALLLRDPELLDRASEDSRSAADAAFRAFPRLGTVVGTRRVAASADRNVLSARLDDRDGSIEAEPIDLGGIVDRIGGGDAFVAGVLDGLLSGSSAIESLRTGMALAALKHSLPRDASLFDRQDLDAFLNGGRDVRR